MINKLLLTVIIILCSSSIFCQTTEDSVKMVVDKMFTAMKAGDSRMLLECFADSAILQTVVKSKDGKVSVKIEPMSMFIRQISAIPKGDADERITYDMVKIDADLASVWTPYQFYYKGNFSHCGVNSFHLVRISGEWKIQYIIDTRRKENCK